MESGNNQENHNPDQEPISKPQDIHENEARISTDNEEDDDGEEEEEEEEEELGFEFSFTLGEAKYPSSPISAEEAFVNGQIKPVVQFNGRDLTTTTAAQSPDEVLNLPSKPPVKNVYVELSGEGRRGAEAEEEGDDVYAVTSSPTPACKKSNSTGFSRIWRFSRDFAMGRSHSDGRDAFVFLNEGHAPPPSGTAADESKSSAVKVKGQKKNKKKKKEEEGEASKSKTVKGSKAKGKKVNNTSAAASSASLSACEVYMRSKADEKRRSTTTYLPYRPGLMGFFTNVSGGMSKNVHPF